MLTIDQHLDNIINNYILLAQVDKQQAFDDLVNDKPTLNLLVNQYGPTELTAALDSLYRDSIQITTSHSPQHVNQKKTVKQPVSSISTFHGFKNSFKTNQDSDSEDDEIGGWEETQAFYEKLWKRKRQVEEEKIESTQKETKLVPICQDYRVGFCRYENISHIGKCKFRHEGKRPSNFSYTLSPANAAADKVWSTKFAQAFDGVAVTVTSIKEIKNETLNTMYNLKCEEIKSRRKADEITNSEPYFFHGTAEKALDSIMKYGINIPPDYKPDPACPVSGKLPISICKNDCKLCTKVRHCWSNCHMYGLGAYFADKSIKSDRYVCDMNGAKDHKIGRKMLVCKFFPGKAKVIDSHLQKQDELHDNILPPHGYDSIFAKGLGSKSISGLSVINSEFIIFHPYQCVPVYLITYNKP